MALPGRSVVTGPRGSVKPIDFFATAGDGTVPLHLCPSGRLEQGAMPKELARERKNPDGLGAPGRPGMRIVTGGLVAASAVFLLTMSAFLGPVRPAQAPYPSLRTRGSARSSPERPI